MNLTSFKCFSRFRDARLLIPGFAVLLLFGCATKPSDQASITPKKGFIDRTEDSITNFLDKTDTAHPGDDNSPQ